MDVCCAPEKGDVAFLANYRDCKKHRSIDLDCLQIILLMSDLETKE